MENGVEKPVSVSTSPVEETKTADGGVAHFSLLDNVVQVFHHQSSSSEEEEPTITTAVHDSDGDDVFEDANPEDHPKIPLEKYDIANGNPSTDAFEEAVDTDLPIEAKFQPALPHEMEGDGKETFAMAVDGDTNDVGLDSRGSLCDAAVSWDSGNGDEVKLVDDSNNTHQEESPDGVACNGEEDENRTSAVILNAEIKSSADESSPSWGAVAHDKSINGGLIKLELEEKPVILANSPDIGRAISAEIPISEGNESDEQIFSDDDQSISASSNGKTENGKIENGGLEMLELEEKPAALAILSDVDKAASNVIALSEETESGEKGFSEQDDQSREMRHTVATADTFVNDENQTTAISVVCNDLGASIGEETDTRKEHPDATIDEKRVGTDAAESEEKDSRNVQAQNTSVNIQAGSVNHTVIKESELQETQNECKKQDSSSIEESRDSGSARETEIQPAAESVEASPRRRPAGLGGAAPLFEPAPRALQQPRVNGAAPQRQAQLVEEPMNGETEESDETREKLQMIRVKFLRLAHRLGQTPHNVVVAQVLYRLGLAEQLRGRNAGRVGAFSFDRASAMAEQLESAGQEPLDFSCTIMVIGKTGVGKSATINSIFDEVKFSTDAFQIGTKKVQDVVGTVQGIKVRVIDTPGLLPCSLDQHQNEKILQSVKRFIKKTPPDIVLYLDRLDMQSRDFGDLPLLRTITEIFGPSIWFNAIVVLTHAASAPPDGPNGISSSYEMFVTQRSHVVQQAIRQAAGDMRLMNPVSLVENHSACRTNRAGQRVLPNGQVWKPHLLLLSFASKILAEANTLLKLQDNPPGKPFATRPRVPPLPFLLSSLLQSRPQLKLPEEQFGDEDDLDDDLDESSESDDESEYDELPPFKRLAKAQLAKLSKAQKKAYFDELEYREKLFMKKQLREEKRRRNVLKKMAGSAKEAPNDYTESVEEESGGGASVPVAMPDFSLPASFDSDNPSHRYRFLDTSNPWLVRPVLETHGWDHDVGYEGINVERMFVVKDKIPVSFSGQATKDKKESNLQMELASSVKHSEGKATSVGFDMQTIGKDMSYTLRSETRFSNFRHNKTAAGLSVTLLGDAITAGVKVEDKVIVNKRFRLVLTGGAMTGRGDVAYGGSLEATLRDKDYPLGRTLSTLGLSIMDWHGDLAIGCNVQSQIPIGRSSNLIARANLNNRGSGQVSIRLNSSEQLQIALVGLLPLVRKALFLYQQMLYGE